MFVFLCLCLCSCLYLCLIFKIYCISYISKGQTHLQELLQKFGGALQKVLLTHHHHDHIDGLALVEKMCPHVTVYGMYMRAICVISIGCVVCGAYTCVSWWPVIMRYLSYGVKFKWWFVTKSRIDLSPSQLTASRSSDCTALSWKPLLST